MQQENASSAQTIQKLENEVSQITMSTRKGVQDVREAIETQRIQYVNLSVFRHALSLLLPCTVLPIPASIYQPVQTGFSVETARKLTYPRYQELRHKTAALRENLQKEILSHIDVIVKAKEHVAAQMQSVLACAENTQ